MRAPRRSPNTHRESLNMAESYPGFLHHFDDPEQPLEASRTGMWVFLATEIMFFGAMFMGYILYRTDYLAVESEGRLAFLQETLVIMSHGAHISVSLLSSPKWMYSAAF